MSTDKLRYHLLLSVTGVDLSGYVPAPFIIELERVANKLGNLYCSPTTDLQLTHRYSATSLFANSALKAYGDAILSERRARTPH
jgi:hypothetical protein